MLGLIDGEELADDREAWSGVVVAVKGKKRLILSHGRKIIVIE